MSAADAVPLLSVKMNILVFPAGMPESRHYAILAARRGATVVAATSVDYSAQDDDPFAARERLPLVSAPEFFPALARLVARHGVTGIFSPHPVVWEALKEKLPACCPNVALLNDHPFDAALAPYRSALGSSGRCQWQPVGLDGLESDLPEWLQTAIVMVGSRIPGQCTLDKLALMATLVASAPAGDVVEIGSLWGRSAYALAMAAQYARIGPLICVDPWQRDCYQQPASSALLSPVIARIDPDEAHRCFLANLAPFAGTHCNYLRMTSAEASSAYSRGREVSSQSYGTTRIQGRISFLHIDGNHDFDSVEADLRLWTPLLAPGSWLVLDDYRWAFGDGPRRAGDRWLFRQGAAVDVAFSALDNLWIRLR